MKILVNEIERDDLVKISSFFLKQNEIIFLEEASNEYSTIDCSKPFYIEENINDLNKILCLCNDVSFGRNEIRNKVEWNTFCLFWALMFSIYKQREMNRKVTDLEYLYEKFKGKYNLRLMKSSELNMCYENKLVLVGESKIGIMHLYKEDEYFDFTFSVAYEKKNVFGKKVIKHTHWHPSNFFEAIESISKFMSDIDEYNLLGD